MKPLIFNDPLLELDRFIFEPKIGKWENENEQKQTKVKEMSFITYNVYFSTMDLKSRAEELLKLIVKKMWTSFHFKKSQKYF